MVDIPTSEFHTLCCAYIKCQVLRDLKKQTNKQAKHLYPYALFSARLGVVRASNIFPILSAILLLMGGVCIAASRFYRSKRNIILGAGILFVAAGNSGISVCVFLWQQCLGEPFWTCFLLFRDI